GDDFLDTLAVVVAVHGLEDLAGFHAPLAVDLTVLLLHAVTGNARNSLQGNRGSLPQRQIAALLHGGSDGDVAAHAEVTDGALRQVVDLLLELVEHRRDGGV